MASVSDKEALLTGGEAGGVDASSKTKNLCCKICCGVFVALIMFVLWVVLRIWTAECAVESFDVNLVLPKNAKDAGVVEPFDRGTKKNMKLDPDLDLDDLAGVWWMAGNPLTYEQLVSFAGAEGKGPFPTIVHNPSNKQRRWTWSDTFIGRSIIAYYALTTMPDDGHDFNFANSSYANIIPVADVFGNDTIFGFKKINKDEWDRVGTYILRRVINPDGSAGPFWHKFLKWYKDSFPSERVVVFSSDNGCKRKWQYFLPCFMCNLIC